MDPLSVVQVLGGLLTLAAAVDNRFGDLERLLLQEQEFAIKYRRSVAALQNEIHNDVQLYNTIIIHGDPNAVRSLLDSDEGKEASERLSATLGMVERLLRAQMKAADHVIEKLKKKEIRFGTVVKSFVVDSALNDADDLNNVVRNAFSDLDERREDVRNTFTHFKTLYELHNSRQQHRKNSAPLPPLPKRRSTSDINNLFESIKFGFFNNAFHVGASKSEEADLASKVHCLNECAEWEERLTELMEGQGKRWVEDQMVEEMSIQKCRKLQSGLLVNLLKVVSPDAGTAMFRTAEGSANSVNRVQLEEINIVIRKSLKQAAEQKYSIAFCGMVKAGFVNASLRPISNLINPRKSLFLNALIGRMVLPSNGMWSYQSRSLLS